MAALRKSCGCSEEIEFSEFSDILEDMLRDRSVCRIHNGQEQHPLLAKFWTLHKPRYFLEQSPLLVFFWADLTRGFYSRTACILGRLLLKPVSYRLL